MWSKWGKRVAFGPKINTFDLFSTSVHCIFSDIVPDGKQKKVTAWDFKGKIQHLEMNHFWAQNQHVFIFSLILFSRFVWNSIRWYVLRNGWEWQVFKEILYYIWDKIFKNGPSKICGRQPLKSLKGYGVLPQILLGPFLNTLSHLRWS